MWGAGGAVPAFRKQPTVIEAMTEREAWGGRVGTGQHGAQRQMGEDGRGVGAAASGQRKEFHGGDLEKGIIGIS